jgi:hypothetical protein
MASDENTVKVAQALVLNILLQGHNRVSNYSLQTGRI